MNSPPAIAIAFVSDAVGVPDPTNPPFAVGVGATGFLLCSGKILYCGQAVWPFKFIINSDIHQKLFDKKTTSLEAIYIATPALLPGNCVVLFVDN